MMSLEQLCASEGVELKVHPQGHYQIIIGDVIGNYYPDNKNWTLYIDTGDKRYNKTYRDIPEYTAIKLVREAHEKGSV